MNFNQFTKIEEEGKPFMKRFNFLCCSSFFALHLNLTDAHIGTPAKIIKLPIARFPAIEIYWINCSNGTPELLLSDL